jgi:hypothetical protein
MPDDTFTAMRQSIIDGAPDTAGDLAQRAVATGIEPLTAINLRHRIWWIWREREHQLRLSACRWRERPRRLR